MCSSGILLQSSFFVRKGQNGSGRKQITALCRTTPVTEAHQFSRVVLRSAEHNKSRHPCGWRPCSFNDKYLESQVRPRLKSSHPGIHPSLCVYQLSVNGIADHPVTVGKQNRVNQIDQDQLGSRNDHARFQDPAARQEKISY